ncbi:MAG: hypothetical protein Q4B87_00400 [Candidatus Saccharibacteria bacterium]|nr:hypothetical protein [Candidatus Saccharibacteria bacterium]
MTKTEIVRRRDYKKTGLLGLLVFVAVFLFAFLAFRNGKLESSTNATNLANFNAGYIISDYQMTDYNSMDENEIRDFLWSKGRCYNTNFSGVGTTVNYFSDSTPPTTWHVSDGHTVCLAEEIINGETAAHIIWQAAQDYKINPKVLIVLIQKETGLITDPVPNSWDYQRTAGYGCPDTAACSEKYYGFKNQIRNAASLFRIVMDGNSSFYPIGNNYIQYNPNAGCGGSNVYIQNLATSALYRYTPYQPNAGALAAGYGTAHCGAYGNRNFYAYFEDWFGGITNTVKPKPTLAEVLSTMTKVPKEETDLDFNYHAHIQDYGWMDWSEGGEMIGTTTYGLAIEAIELKLKDGNSGIEYRTHVQNKGWGEYKKDGDWSGTVGESLRVEALQIRLTNGLENKYDVYYRAHVENIGWMDWVKNNEIAGTTGKSLRVEALQVKLVRKGLDLNVAYSAHVQDIGWMNRVDNGTLAGTTGMAKRLEALKIELVYPEMASRYGITYRAHVQNKGWLEWVKSGEISGTIGEALRVEAIEAKLSDAEVIQKYDLLYRTHVQNIGWTDWVKNGETSGTVGKALRVEAIEIKLVEK